MDEKLVALVIITLLAGTGVGYGSGYVMFQPQVSELKSDVSSLQSEVSTLTTNYNDLNTTYNDLVENYNNLNATYNDLLANYNSLDTAYEDLLFHYNLLNGPASNFTTIQDLQIAFTTHRTTYYYKDPISGNVTITYLNGTAFRGAFTLYIRHLTKEGMSTTAWIAIDGFTEYYLSPPVFLYGPGNYTIGISSLSTADGYIIESRWNVFPSVQVETK